MKKLPKRLLTFTAVVFLTITLFIALLPTIICSQILNPALSTFSPFFINGSLHANKMSASWFGGIQLQGVTLQDRSGEDVIQASNIAYKSSLFSLFFSPFPSGSIDVEAPYVLVTNDKGSVVLDAVLASKQTTSSVPKLTLSNLQLHLDIAEGKTAAVNLDFHVQGEQNSQNNKADSQGRIQIQASATTISELTQSIKNIFSNSSESITDVEAECQIKITSLPTSLLDAGILAFEPKAAGLATRALGPLLNATSTQSLKNEKLTTTVQVESQNLQTTLDMTIHKGSVTMAKDAKANYIITNDFVKTIGNLIQKPEIKDISLQKNVPVELIIGNSTTEDKQITLSLAPHTPFVFENPSWKTPLSFSFTANGALSLEQKQFRASFDTQGAFSGEKLHAKATLAINNFYDFNAQSTHATLHASAHPFALINLLSEKIKNLDGLTGKKVELAAQASITAKKSDASWKIYSDTLASEGALEYKDSILSINAANLAATLSAETLKALGIQSAKSALDIQATLTSCQIPNDISKATFDLKAIVKPFSLESTSFETTNFHISKEESKDLLATLTTDFNYQSLDYRGLVNAAGTVKLRSTGYTNALLQLENVKLQESTAAASSETYQLQLPISYAPEKKSISGSINLQSDKQAMLQAQFSAAYNQEKDSDLFSALTAKVTATFDKVTSALLLPIHSELPPLVGPTLSGNINFQYDPNSEAERIQTATIIGTDLEVRLKFALGSDITASNPLDIRWKVTPERFSALQRMISSQNDKQKALLLQKPFWTTLAMQKLAFQMKTPFTQASFLDALNVDIALTTEAIECLMLEKKIGGTAYPIAIAPLKGACQFKAKTQGISFSFETDKDVKDAAQIMISGRASHLWGENGFDSSKADITLDLKINELPLDMLHAVTSDESTADQVVDVLGNTVSVSMKGRVKELNKGTFDGTITSPRLQSTLSCALRDGTLFLNKPIEAHYTLTPEAGRVLLKDVNPLLVTAARSKAPISLWIDSEGFSMPLKSFSLPEMQIKTIKIDPGVLYAKNGGMLSLLTSFLKIKSTNNQEISLWFTPIYIGIKKGIVDCKRCDVLLEDQFPLTTWGTIDLIRDKLDMILGLSGQALAKTFNLTRVDADSIIQVPIKGTTGSPRFDTGRATAKITALKLQEHKKTTGILGGLLDIAASVGDKEKTPPKPTTHPFPWNKT